jgi:hypothetical protein
VTRWRIPIAAMVCALALTSCGGGGTPGVSAAVYVKRVCTTLTAWESDVRAAGGQLQAGTSAAKSLAQGKAQYVTFIDALVAATGKATGGLKTAGIPAVSNGKGVEGALVSAFTRVTASLAQAAGQARNIPTTNAGSYQAAAAGVTAHVRQSLAGIASTTPERSPPLRAAAAKDPTCRALSTGA